MNTLEKQVKQILSEANSRLLTESAKSDAQEENVVRALLQIGIYASPGGGYKPYDLSIAGAHFEVKEETGSGNNKKLAKLGSAKTGPIVKDGYISAIQVLAKIMDDVADELKNLGLDQWIYDWWKTPAPKKKDKDDDEENQNQSRAVRLIRLEISQSLFSEITVNSGDAKGFKPMLDRLIEFLSFEPNKSTETTDLISQANEKKVPKKISIGDEEIEVDDNLYRRILIAVKKSKFTDAESLKKRGGVSRLYNAVDDVLSQMPSDWNAYKRTLGQLAASEGKIAGIFGVRGLGTPPDPDVTKPIKGAGEITFYLPTELEVIQMTQGARAVLRPFGDGIEVYPNPDIGKLKSLFATTAKAEKLPTKNPALESKIRDSIKEMLKS